MAEQPKAQGPRAYATTCPQPHGSRHLPISDADEHDHMDGPTVPCLQANGTTCFPVNTTELYIDPSPPVGPSIEGMGSLEYRKGHLARASQQRCRPHLFDIYDRRK